MTDLATTEPRPGPRLVESIHQLAAAAVEAFSTAGAHEVAVDWIYPSDAIAESDERITIIIRSTPIRYD